MSPFTSFGGNMTGIVALNIAVSSTNNYKGKPCFAGPIKAKIYTITWVITGTLTGTVIFEGTNSDDVLVQQDVGNVANQTDLATWIKVAPIYDGTDTIVASASIAITNSTTDAIAIDSGVTGFKALRPRYTNATGSGTIVFTVTTRER